ncbi:MAG TPA: mersacidin/lichenicidin family type 2 lantibiotic [Chloroflexia bacterium]|nr:mersacidin/lichenicidin family type 2 lantibiotic [Chloroflexia bacterium]HEX2913351.1 mersacidin/lichenicidin family type 2 lantibiotic [Chloroflexia bacterium]
MNSMNLDVIRAWKDEDYREGLSDEQKSQLSENPAGMVELSDEELGNAEGAITPIIIGSLISLNYAVWSSIC